MYHINSFTLQAGDTVLHIAAQYGEVEAVELIVQRGANVHSVNKVSYSSPIHFCCVNIYHSVHVSI